MCTHENVGKRIKCRERVLHFAGGSLCVCASSCVSPNLDPLNLLSDIAVQSSVVSWGLSNGNLSVASVWSALLCPEVFHLVPSSLSMFTYFRGMPKPLCAQGCSSGLHSETALSFLGEHNLSLDFKVVLQSSLLLKPFSLSVWRGFSLLLGIPFFAAALLFTKLRHTYSYSESGKTVRWPPT